MVMKTASKGFTIIELIVTMIVVGILAVVILPRFASVNAFDTVGFADQATALLRFAQKTAIARHQMVYVSLASTPPTFCAYSYSGTPTCAAASCTSTLPLPGGSYHAAKTTVTFASGSTTALCFDALGKPYASSGAALSSQVFLTVNNESGTAVRTIYVERETGYVH